jgi:hypothetical protein
MRQGQSNLVSWRGDNLDLLSPLYMIAKGIYEHHILSSHLSLWYSVFQPQCARQMGNVWAPLIVIAIKVGNHGH